jgi:hypothetical protein
MKLKFRKHGFPNEVVKIVEPIIQMIIQNQIAQAEKEIARLALEVCEGIERESLSPKRGNDYFTLLDLNLPENCPSISLRKETRDLLFEGMILHDYGKEYGADIMLMRRLAGKLLEERSQSSN